MKGIVVEINKKDAVILSDEGLFTRVKNKDYQVGQAVRIEENRRTAQKWIAGAASMAAALAFCTIGSFAYYTPTDYVSLDVNPSIEYSVNRFDRILDAKAKNDDGEAILSGLDLKNKTIQDGLKETLDQLIAGGYLADSPDSGVVITTSNEDMEEAEQLATDLEQEVTAYLDTQDSIAAEVDAEAVGLGRVEEARALGVTPGKLNLVEKLQASTSGAINREEWLAMPVKEINKAIKENRRQEKENAKDEIKGGGDSEGDSVSNGGIRRQDDDSQKHDKTHPNEPGNWKDNRGNSQDDRNRNDQSKHEKEQALNQTTDRKADAINNKTKKTDDDWQQEENQDGNGSGHDGKNKPDNGKSPTGNDD